MVELATFVLLKVEWPMMAVKILYFLDLKLEVEMRIYEDLKLSKVMRLVVIQSSLIDQIRMRDYLFLAIEQFVE